MRGFQTNLYLLTHPYQGLKRDWSKAKTSLPPSGIVIHDRKIYRDAIATGHGVVELLNEKAQAEIDALGHEIYR